MSFEWDESKNEANIAKHGISFEAASLIFDGALVEYVDDPLDYGETKVIAIGEVEGRLLCIVYTVRGEARRLISARRANRHERRAYREIYPKESP